MSSRAAGKEADAVGRRAACKAAKRPRSEAKPSEAWAPAKDGSRAKAGPCTGRGFTLFEVLAGILVLSLIYTVLASAAISGLRSEGIDRRRAEASLVADRELSAIESQLATGASLQNGLVEKEAAPYTVVVDVQPADVLELLPTPLREEIVRGADPAVPTLLVDEQGQSRLQRLSVVVQWDEAGEPDRVERTTYAFDTSDLAELFPSEGEPGAEGEPEDNFTRALRELGEKLPPEFEGAPEDPEFENPEDDSR